MNPMNRRRFLTSSALAAVGGAALGRSVYAQEGGSVVLAPPSERLQVGLIGCGGMGIGDLATFFQYADVDCPIVCDIDDANIAKAVALVEAERGHRPETVKDFRRVIDAKHVDALLVATPDHWHALPTVYGCQAGKDVYVEKPLARSIDEGRAMLEAMQRHSRVVQMGTQWRSGTHYADAVAFVQSGKLGKIRLVRAWAYLDWVGGIGSPPDGAPPAGVDYDLWLGPSPARPFNPNRFHFNFRWFWDYAGGLMTDWGVHLLNICLWAMGPETPLKVSASGGKRVVEDNTETPDTQVAVYDFPSYTLIWEHQMQGGVGPNGRPHGVLFSGTEGALLIDESGWQVIPEPKRDALKAGKPGTDAPVFPQYPGETHPAGRDARPAHARNFLDCVKSRELPVENLHFAHHVSTVAHLGNLALRANAEVHWDAEKEVVTSSPEADAMVSAPYRAPWDLPYRRRA